MTITAINPYLELFQRFPAGGLTLRTAPPSLEHLRELTAYLPAGWEGELDVYENERQQAHPFAAMLAARCLLVQMYAWAIPSEEALDAIAQFPAVVEIGAGTGYWASVLEERGVQVAAYDIAPRARSYAKVIQGDETCALHHPEAALLLCWPPLSDPMAANALDYYQGRHLIYVGEGNGGCTADDRFHKLVARDWEEVDSYRIPRWEGIRDSMTIYRRRAV